MLSPVSAYAGVVEAVQVPGFVVPCKEANRFVARFTTLPELLIESWVAAYAKYPATESAAKAMISRISLIAFGVKGIFISCLRLRFRWR